MYSKVGYWCFFRFVESSFEHKAAPVLEKLHYYFRFVIYRHKLVVVKTFHLGYLCCDSRDEILPTVTCTIQDSAGLYKYWTAFDVLMFYYKMTYWFDRNMCRAWLSHGNISPWRDQSDVENFKYFTWPNYDLEWDLGTCNSHICVHELSWLLSWIEKKEQKQVDLYFSNVRRDLDCFIWGTQKRHYMQRCGKALKIIYWKYYTVILVTPISTFLRHLNFDGNVMTTYYLSSRKMKMKV